MGPLSRAAGSAAYSRHMLRPSVAAASPPAPSSSPPARGRRRHGRAPTRRCRRRAGPRSPRRRPRCRRPRAPGPPRAVLLAFSSRRAMRTVRHLADEIGPRLATGPAFRRAARWVEERLRRPRATTWRGRPSPYRPGTRGACRSRPAARSTWSRARAASTRAAPYLVVGAHLDTVAVAPGAEDNASGVAVLLETARRVRSAPPACRWCSWPSAARSRAGPATTSTTSARGTTSPRCHRAERRHLRGDGVPGPGRRGDRRAGLLGRAARPIAVRAGPGPGGAGALGVGTVVEPDAASDHESFADAGLPAARLGSTPYAGYHSAARRARPSSTPPSSRRVGRVIWAWLLRGR